MTKKRKAAIILLILPFVVAAPYCYWVFNVAGSWYVSTELEPEHRAGHLAEMCFADMCTFMFIAYFVALVLLCLDGYHRKITAPLLVPSSLLAVVGSAWLAHTVYSYFRFSGP